MPRLCDKYGCMSKVQSLRPDVKLTAGRLRVAGWLAMASSLLTLPWFLFTYSLVSKSDLPIKAAKAAMIIGRLALFAYLILIFQQLLNRRHSFHGADAVISLLIQASIIQASAAILGLAVPELAAAIQLFGFIMVVILGILHIMFGSWLLHLPASLGGMHRPFCYLNIVTGAALVSILLLPLGIFTSTVADIMLGTIFLHAAKTFPVPT